MWTVSWQIKASKFCNLRCRYCYEWKELGQRERISLEGWRKILAAAKRYHELQTKRFGEAGQSVITWHGGEPLALGKEYWEEVLALSHEILGETGPDKPFTYVIQTNLYSLSDGMIEIFKRERFRASVSLDMAPGVRTTIGGEETEGRVAANIDRLLEHGIPVTCHAVLGGHTKDRLAEIHDFFAQRGIGFGLTPLFDAPMVTAGSGLAISHEQVAQAIEALFVYWMEQGCRVPVFNLKSYLQTVLMRMAGLERLAWDARANGERVLVVNTDGTLWSIVERYRDGQSMGNLLRQTIDEVLESAAYKDSVRRREERRRRHCNGCRYQGACDSEPIFAIADDYPAGPCPIAARVCGFIERYLRCGGYDEGRVVAEIPRIGVPMAAM